MEATEVRAMYTGGKAKQKINRKTFQLLPYFTIALEIEKKKPSRWSFKFQGRRKKLVKIKMRGRRAKRFIHK